MKVSFLVEIEVDPMNALDLSLLAHEIKDSIWEGFAHLGNSAIAVKAAPDPWALISDGNKNELIKVAYKAIRHGFGDHPENLTDMDKLAGSIAKRMVGELWARRKK